MINQFKLSLLTLIIVTISFISCQTKPDKSFSQIPEGLSSVTNLIRKIRPQVNYKYWTCILSNPALAKTEIITSNSDINELMKFKFTPPNMGFYNEMWTGYYYIVYLENDKIGIVHNRKELIRFIGKINSLQKTLLIANINGFNIDYKRPIGSSYKKVKNGYELYLVKFHKCTVKTEPFKVYIDSFGKCYAKSLAFYYNVDENTCED